MIYSFDIFELDIGKAELRERRVPAAVEPQVFSLLVLLAKNVDRLVSKEELAETIWAERVVSDSAISSRIKSAQQALGDDGVAQKFIKTIHGQSLRFVQAVGQEDAQKMSSAVPANLHPPAPNPTPEEPASSRPSIAILPLRLVGNLHQSLSWLERATELSPSYMSKVCIPEGEPIRFRGVPTRAGKYR